MNILQPPGWPRPQGYANGIAARGRQVYTAGLIGWDERQNLAGEDFVAQARQTFRNVVAVLAEAGAAPRDIVRMTWYVTDKREYLDAAAEVGRVYREIFGRHYPAMAVVQVAALIEDRAKLEIEVTAVVPD